MEVTFSGHQLPRLLAVCLVDGVLATCHLLVMPFWKQPKSLAALSLCSYLIATQILWNSFWIPSPGEVVVQSYLFIYWIRKGDTFNISHIDLNEWSVADSRIKAKNLKIC